MQPCRMRCYHYNKAFSFGFNSPQTSRHQADSIILRIDFTDGRSAYGECAPRLYVTGETHQSVVHLMRDCFSPLLFASTVDSLAAVELLLDHLENTCRKDGISSYHSALGGIELALIDALERFLHLPPNQLFPTRYRSELRFCASIPFLPLSAIEANFPLLRAHIDMPIIKILMGEDVDANLARVKLMRRLAASDTELRLEFNGKAAFDHVRKNLERLMPFDISAVEQPLPRHDWEGIERLRRQFDVAFIADESLVNFEDAQQLAQSGCYAIFNIKVSKCGGLLRSKRIAELADAHGIPCQIGTHVGESPLLTVAGQRLAHGLPNFDCYGGGSDILFSRLFEPSTGTAEAPHMAGQETDPNADDNCRALVSTCEVLLDCRSPID